MIDSNAVYVGERIIHHVTRKYGFITTVRARRPTMFEVKWDDASTGWYHPEMLDKPDIMVPPPVVKRTPARRTAPKYIRPYRRGVKPDRQKMLEKEANKFMQRKGKGRRWNQGTKITQRYPSTRVIIPTPEEIERSKSKDGEWTKHQLARWGVPWPPPKGWIRDLTMKGRSTL